MARLSDKEFAITFELRQLQADRNRLERIKERTDSDLDETRQRIRALKKQLEKSQKPAKKKAAPKKSAKKLVDKIEENKKTFEPEESEVKIDADSMTAVEDSVELKDKSTKKAPKEKAEDEKTDPAE